MAYSTYRRPAPAPASYEDDPRFEQLGQGFDPPADPRSPDEPQAPPPVPSTLQGQASGFGGSPASMGATVPQQAPPPITSTLQQSQAPAPTNTFSGYLGDTPNVGSNLHIRLGGYNADSTPVGPMAQQASGDNASGVSGDSGSRFVNFERYMNANLSGANKGATQVANTVGNKAKNASTALTGAENTFEDSVRKGTPGDLYNGQSIDPSAATSPTAGTPGQPVTGTGSSALTGLPDGSPTGTPPPENSTAGSATSPALGLQSDTSALSGNPQKGTTGAGISRDAAAALAHQTYTGPSSLAEAPGFDKVTGAIQSASKDVNSLQDDAGRQAYLQKNTAGPYSQGQSAFDSALYGGAGQSKFAALQKQFGGLGNELDTKVAQAGQVVQGAKGKVADSNRSYQGLVDAFDAEKPVRDATAAADAAGRDEAALNREINDPSVHTHNQSDAWSPDKQAWQKTGVQNVFAQNGGTGELWNKMTDAEIRDFDTMYQDTTGDDTRDALTRLNGGASTAQKTFLAKMKQKYHIK